MCRNLQKYNDKPISRPLRLLPSRTSSFMQQHLCQHLSMAEESRRLRDTVAFFTRSSTISLLKKQTKMISKFVSGNEVLMLRKGMKVNFDEINITGSPDGPDDPSPPPLPRTPPPPLPTSSNVRSSGKQFFSFIHQYIKKFVFLTTSSNAKFSMKLNSITLIVFDLSSLISDL